LRGAKGARELQQRIFSAITWNGDYPKLLLYSHLIPTQVSQAADILSISKSTVHFAAGVIAVSIGAAMPVRFSIWPLPRVRQGFS
jgi:hypothetical protein